MEYYFTNTYISSCSINACTDASLTYGQLFKYNGTSWINFTPTCISSCSINACTDATLTSLVTNNLLMYNGLKWINSTKSLEMDNDVNESSC